MSFTAVALAVALIMLVLAPVLWRGWRVRRFELRHKLRPRRAGPFAGLLELLWRWEIRRAKAPPEMKPEQDNTAGLVLTLQATGPGALGPTTRRFEGERLVVGRGADSDWVLDDPERELSRRHCVIERRGGRYWVTDTSVNGVYVNGAAQALGNGGTHPLADGDRLRLGSHTLTVRIEEVGPAAPPPEPEPVPSRGDLFDTASAEHDLEPPEHEPATPRDHGAVQHDHFEPSRAAAPPPQDQDVRFTVYHPKEIAVERWDTLLVYAHIPEREQWVHADAQTRLDRPEGHGWTAGRATRSITRGAEIVVVPELPGCRFNPPADRFLWLEDAHRREFRLRTDPEVPGFAPGTAVNGRVAFYVMPILIAEVTIWAFMSDQADDAAGPRAPDWPRSGAVTPMGFAGLSEARTPFSGARQLVTTSADPYHAIFVSYAHKDSAVVARLGAAYKALGMSFLRDQEVLRSGERWNPRLLALIEGADIFQLYWSQAARRSRYVRQEWRHALQQERENFVRPVYWRKPLPRPPRDLGHLHFAYVPLDG